MLRIVKAAEANANEAEPFPRERGTSLVASETLATSSSSTSCWPTNSIVITSGWTGHTLPFLVVSVHLNRHTCAMAEWLATITVAAGTQS
jgi:hypothetical protein